MRPPDQPEDEFALLRRAMVETQISKRGVTSPRVLEAMLAVPRHEFVAAESQAEAYADKPLAIGEGQTISQPFIVAAMTQALDLTGSERVLEIGAGSGYQAAVLSVLAREVISVETHAALADAARARLARLGYANVRVYHADGSLGLSAEAPFDCIMITAGAPRIPALLAEQLREGGRMVVPVGDQENQELLLATKLNGELRTRVLFDCRFVPLTGEHGWGFSARNAK